MTGGDDLICIDHNGRTKCFPFEVKKWSYAFQFIVTINGVKVIYEPDEEEHLRARMEGQSTTSMELREIVRLVAEQIKLRLDSKGARGG